MCVCVCVYVCVCVCVCLSLSLSLSVSTPLFYWGGGERRGVKFKMTTCRVTTDLPLCSHYGCAYAYQWLVYQSFFFFKAGGGGGGRGKEGSLLFGGGEKEKSNMHINTYICTYMHRDMHACRHTHACASRYSTQALAIQLYSHKC